MDDDDFNWMMTAPEEEGPLWLRTDEVGEFIDALEHSARLGAETQHDARYWRWLILAMHVALQGACVCALRGRDTTNLSVLKRDSAEAQLQWLNVDSRLDAPPEPPDERLEGMLGLYGRVRRRRWLPDPYRLPASGAVSRDVQRLNRIRNDFVHFVPKGLSLETIGLPRIFMRVCDVIEHLAVTHPTFAHHLDEQRSTRVREALASLRSMRAWVARHLSNEMAGKDVSTWP